MVLLKNQVGHKEEQENGIFICVPYDIENMPIFVWNEV